MTLYIAIIVYILGTDVKLETYKTAPPAQCEQVGLTAIARLLDAGLEPGAILLGQCVGLRVDGRQS